MKCLNKTLWDGACGVRLLHNFSEGSGYGKEIPKLGEASLSIAAFIDTKTCKKMYKQLKSQFKLVYQSSVRLNTNSDNMFFFCVYDKKDTK